MEIPGVTPKTDVLVGASELSQLLNYRYILDIFRKKLRRITT